MKQIVGLRGTLTHPYDTLVRADSLLKATTSEEYKENLNTRVDRFGSDRSEEALSFRAANYSTDHFQLHFII